MMDRTLKIGTWNANGLLHHLSELKIFLDIEHIDICLVSETHFSSGLVLDDLISNYICYHAPHPADKARGGSAILIKKSLKHHEEAMFTNENMQVTIISIGMKKKDFKLASIYCPPRRSPTEDDYTELLNLLGHNFLVGGDFNAKHTHWGSRLITTKGRRLYKACLKYNCEFYSSRSPTYWPSDTSKIPDLVDFFIVKGIKRNHIRVEGNYDLSSDHTPVILSLNESEIMEKSNPKLVNNKTNWSEFREKLESYINLRSPMETKEQIDLEVEQFIADVQQAAEESTPTYSSRKQTETKYPAEIRELILEKRRARRKWQNTRFPDDKTAFNRLSNELKKQIYEFKNDSLSRFLKNLTTDASTDYSLWKAAKRLKRPQLQNPPIKSLNGNWIGNPKEKANLFAEHLANVFKPFPANTSENSLQFIDKVDEVDIPIVTLKEIKSMCRNQLSNKKSPGYDLITAQVMKEMPSKAFIKLQFIINACLKTQYVPHHWKIAEVIVIPKQGKPPTEVTSYRPISLIPIMAKVFEKLLLKRLSKVIEERNLIPNHQFGFRNKHSTIDQVHRITDAVEKALEEKQVCSAIFLDVAQAFDKVWHEGLEYKLQRDLPRQYYEILKSYISNRLFRVRYDQEYSKLCKIQAGVPQGSVLGPTLYLLYTRDIPVDNNTIMATFADDTAILASSKCVVKAAEKLQNAVDTVSDWTKKWRIKLNEAKSAHINFTNKKLSYVQIFINNQAVPYANTAKYLGMNLDAKLKWKEHIKKKREELNLKYRKMYWLLGRNSDLSVENKIMLYKQVLRPVWTYGIQLWGCTKKTNTEIIQKFQNKVLRGIVNAPWYIRNSDLHRDLQIETVTEVVRKHAVSHNQRLHSHINSEMESVLNTRGNVRRLRRTKPHELMV